MAALANGHPAASLAAPMLSSEQIARAQAVNIGDIARERGLKLDRKGDYAGPCPRCGGTDRFSISARKGVFICRQCQPKGGGGAIALAMFLDGIGFREAVEVLVGERSISVKSQPIPAAKNSAEYERRQHEKGALYWLWSQRRPITASIAEIYLRAERVITCPLPPTPLHSCRRGNANISPR